MAYLDPQEAFESFRDSVVESLKTQFPLEGKAHTVHLERVDVPEKLHPDSVKEQQIAKRDGRTWAEPVYGTMVLKDNTTGKVVDKRKVRLAEIPRMTKRYSYIVGGQEYQVDNQWQLKPGAYARRRQQGDLEVQFNTQGGKSFDMMFNPAKKTFQMEWNKAKVPAYPVLKAMGLSDDQLEKTWGKEVFEANQSARGVAGTLQRMYKADRGSAVTPEKAEEYVREQLLKSQMNPEATKLTLGKPLDHVNGDALHSATKRLLDMQAGGKEDDRDSLIFKRLRTAGDFAQDKIRSQAWRAKQKMLRKLDGSAQNVRDVVKFDHFNTPIVKTFNDNQASSVAKQINPLEMVSASMQTTVMGPGGIKSEHGIVDETKFINTSHFGYLDPIVTPEGAKTGVSLRLPLGLKKVGDEPMIPLFNLKTNKMEMVPPAKMMSTNVVLPDQMDWTGKTPKPVGKSVKLFSHDNELKEGDPKQAQYAMRYPTQVFNLTSNLVPFLHSTQGNRAGMAARHMEQAISLKEREKPLVQVDTGFGKAGAKSFEELIGKQAGHSAPMSGTIKKVTKDGIVITGKDGKDHEVQLYDNYPLTDSKSFLQSHPTVKPGDKVAEGQHIADTNYSKDGHLALGTNLRAAYLPYKGYNFEDGIVISESAAKKMSSEHMQKYDLKSDEHTKLDPKLFMRKHPGTYTKDQLGLLGDDGVVKVGQKVKPGDPLVLATAPFRIKDRVGLGAIRKNLSGAHSDKSLKWSSDFDGEVVSVNKKKDGSIQVHVRSTEPMQIGDKMSGRYGNKGVVTAIIPDEEMPRTKDGKPIQVALNPFGVPGRINPSQVFETVAAKVAEKTGKPLLVKSFGTQDQVGDIKRLIKKHKVEDAEELYDPTTGHSLGKVTVGPQYLLKLVHQVEKKGSVRSGMSRATGEQEGYDSNLQPGQGGHHGGQSVGSLGLYALLAHGAKANLREMQTFKSEGEDPQTSPQKRWKGQHKKVWEAIQMGTPVPTPQPTFAFEKFTSYMKAAGVNMDKKGHNFILSPMTDSQVKSLSTGALPNPDMKLSYKVNDRGEPMPIKGGLFDEKITGGHGGRKWTHIPLSEPVPNPMFEKAIKSVIGLKQSDYQAVVYGEKAVLPNGMLTTKLDQGTTGGAGIKMLLQNVNVEKELTKAKEQLSKAPATKVDPALKKVKYLQALKKVGMKPEEAYVLHNLPVIPPVMRPASIMKDGSINEADLNGLYSQFATTNRQLGDPVLKKNEPPEERQATRKEYYDGVRAIMGVGVPYADQKQKGLLHQIHGPYPKAGMFQETLNNRRQDLSMRSTIIPEPGLGIDEVGVPKQYALDLFKPFVVKQMVQMGHAPHPLAAQKLIDGKDPRATIALEKVMEDRPVLLKRDPILHKYGIQGFKPKLVEGSAIKINPLTCSGYNADFDGDAMSLYVPVSQEAQQEARKMMPSNNLFSEASGRVMYSPTHEGAAGLYRLGMTTKKPSTKVSNPGAAIEMVRKGKLTINDKVTYGKTTTTPGRILLSSVLPEPMQKQALTDFEMKFDKKGVAAVLSRVGKEHKDEFGNVSNRLNDLGNGTAFGVAPILSSDQIGEAALDPKKRAWVPTGATTLTLDDFDPDRGTRDRLLGVARGKVQQIHGMKLSEGEKERRTVAAWTAADRAISVVHEAKAKRKPPNNLRIMKEGAGKPSTDQYKQLATAPMLVQDTSGRTIPVPITRTFGEGVDVSQYWTGMYGARRGLVKKVQEVQDPGVLSKMMQNTAMDQVVVSPDCETGRGVAMPVVDKEVHDRVLAVPFKAGKLNLPAGTELTPDVVGYIRSAKKDAMVVVRSPLKCQHEHGLCQKCMGLGTDGKPVAIGTNVGVQATHAIGEPTTQLMMRQFHCMHEHSVVLVKEDGKQHHTTLGRLYDRYKDDPVQGVEVLDRDGWTRVKKVVRHAQHPGTAMVMCRTRSGNFIISQDNHPHMMFDNHAACPQCNTYPKRSNGGNHYYCRKCGWKWDGEPEVSDEAFMVMPEQMTDKSHRALLVRHDVKEEAPPTSDGWLTGMYCAEGFVMHKTQRGYVDHPVGIEITQNRGTLVYDALLSEMKAEWAKQIKLCKNGVRVFSTKLGQEYEELFGRYSRNMGLPDGWSGYPDEWKAAFISGCVDGDGTKVTNKDSKNPVVRIDTTSPLLAAQLHHMLREFGVHARVILTKRRKLSRHQGMAVTFVLTKQVQALLHLSLKLQPVRGLSEDQRQERFSDVVDYVRPFYFASPPDVYDLETESHTLVVNGIWTHNTGGVVGKANVSDQFKHVENLMKLPDKVENQATLAMKGGTIERIERDRTGARVWVGGTEHFVGRDRYGAFLHERPPRVEELVDYKGWQMPKVGQKVRVGQSLSDPNRTVVNPKDLYRATGNIGVVQNHLTDGLHTMFGPEGVRRVHSEVMVRAMTGSTRVKSSGDHPDILRGEVHNSARIRNINKDLKRQGKRPIMHAPDLKGIDTLPAHVRDDWMAKLQHNRLRDTIIEASAQGASSNIHGTHPIPGIAYGAEFGYNVQHSLRPGFEKYKDVPKYSY